MPQKVLLAFLSTLLFFNIIVDQCVAEIDFSYNGEAGPDHWATTTNTCNGKHQSPININVVNVEETTYPELNRSYFYSTPNRAKILNNGHTVVVRFEHDDNEIPRIGDGPMANLGDDFIFSQFHFHWGENDTIGSEDRIDNITFPAELHIVFSNAKYKNLSEAILHKHGLAVLAFFFEITPEDNVNYGEFIELLEKVRDPYTEAEFINPPSLQSLIIYDLNNYYTYIGSLTTPPCSEDVFWLDFIQPIPISPKQIRRFRELFSAPGELLMNNFRPVQPLNDRIVYKNLARLPVKDHHGIPLVTFAGSNSFKNTKPMLGMAFALFLTLYPYNMY